MGLTKSCYAGVNRIRCVAAAPTRGRLIFLEPRCSLPQGILNTLLDREAYRVCPLLPSGNFVSFCRARKMNVQAERLRQLERLGLVLPMLRIYRIDVPH